VDTVASEDSASIKTADVLTAVKEQNNNLPTDFVLEQNFPNPFNPSTTIEYKIPKLSNVKLVIYNILGREVKTLVDAERSPGQHEVTFDGSRLPSGVYLYRMTAANFTDIKKFILEK
jgi:hypothetical protein